MSEATVSTWFKKPGDTVAQDEMLCELETDKVSVEVPAPAAGVLSAILAPEGSTVAANAKLATITAVAAGGPAPEVAATPASRGARRRPGRGAPRPPPRRTSRMPPPRRKRWPRPGSPAMPSPAPAATAA